MAQQHLDYCAYLVAPQQRCAASRLEFVAEKARVSDKVLMVPL
jgi:hypothetical protein